MGYLAARLGPDQPSPRQIEHLIGELKQAILTRVQPEGIFVFGSAAWGPFTQASDLDFAVIFASDEALSTARKRLFKSPPLIPWPYDLLLYTAEEFARKANEGGVCQVILERGRRLL